MNIFELYESQTAAGDWSEALVTIQKIIIADPLVGTSWFNQGVCLDELQRHDEAAESFIKAQEFDIEDYGIHYRVLRSAYLAKNEDLFFDFAEYSCRLDIDFIKAIEGEKLFKNYSISERFSELKKSFQS